MSKCISARGEYSDHELDDTFTCTFCHVLDEDAMRDELLTLRSAAHRRMQMLAEDIWARSRSAMDEAYRTGDLKFAYISEGLSMAAQMVAGGQP